VLWRRVGRMREWNKGQRTLLSPFWLCSLLFALLLMKQRIEKHKARSLSCGIRRIFAVVSTTNLFAHMVMSRGVEIIEKQIIEKHKARSLRYQKNLCSRFDD
jgi:hypothetical protein